MAVKEGWTGRVYEDFEVGDIYVSIRSAEPCCPSTTAGSRCSRRT